MRTVSDLSKIRQRNVEFGFKSHAISHGFSREEAAERAALWFRFHERARDLDMTVIEAMIHGGEVDDGPVFRQTLPTDRLRAMVAMAEKPRPVPPYPARHGWTRGEHGIMP